MVEDPCFPWSAAKYPQETASQENYFIFYYVLHRYLLVHTRMYFIICGVIWSWKNIYSFYFEGRVADRRTEREGGRERKTDIFCPLINTQMVTTARTRPGWFQEPGTLSWSPTWAVVAWVIIFCFSKCLGRKLEEKWSSQGSNQHSQAALTGSRFTCCAPENV